ncbi:TlpA family protein disulfide reductase [Solitalea koreensis]|uniref:Thiol-disulfide isomerase or thioredoxin n=1 Tax=Solitalea koreensis TaxID=543615 RepID=A0A521E1M1_9SPHI|nr:TlpA disulfide reductase family protein [Solitalea koreensis]SMO77854.1 Thiol-disulfide isomerase or thioredoxin [Solitalea koreensis]
MKKLFQLFSLWLLFPLTAVAQDSVTISGKIRNFEKYKEDNIIQIYVKDIVLDNVILYGSKINPDGTFKISFPKDSPQHIFFRCILDYPISLLVNPGDKVFVSMDAKNAENSLEFSGDGAQTNKVLTPFYRKFTEYVGVNMTVFQSCRKDSSAAVFKKYRYNMLAEQTSFYNQFVKEYKTTPQFKQWAKYFLEYQCAADLMSYRWEHEPEIDPRSDYFDFFERFKLNNPEAAISTSYGEYLHDYGNHIMIKVILEGRNNAPAPDFHVLIDRVLDLAKNLSDEEKATLLKFRKNDSINLASKDTLIVKNVFEKNKGLLTISPPFDALTKTSGYLRDVLMANYLYHNIKNKQSDKIAYQMELFQKLVKDEKIKHKILAEYKAGLENLNHPSFAEGILKNLIEKYKGKVIYIDFWATWCGPCREEMPNSNKLHHELKDKDVVFLYLGNQSEEKKWKSLIAELNIQGEHYLLNNNEYNELAAKFKITGIPHYLLIDKQGRIRDEDAKFPGMPELKTDILALLNENI